MLKLSLVKQRKTAVENFSKLSRIFFQIITHIAVSVSYFRETLLKFDFSGQGCSLDIRCFPQFGLFSGAGFVCVEKALPTGTGRLFDKRETVIVVRSIA
jgi:hypothetical protein